MVLEMRSDALAETRLTPESLEPADGQALLRILRFGCTANNVTYWLLGEQLGFARYFPAPAGWSRVPAWGIAEVTASRTDAVREGERFFGYFPMATDVMLTPFSGQDRLDGDVEEAWSRYAGWADTWLTVRHAAGPEAVRSVFLDVLGGRVAPGEAHVVSMHQSV